MNNACPHNINFLSYPKVHTAGLIRIHLKIKAASSNERALTALRMSGGAVGSCPHKRPVDMAFNFHDHWTHMTHIP